MCEAPGVASPCTFSHEGTKIHDSDSGLPSVASAFLIIAVGEGAMEGPTSPFHTFHVSDALALTNARDSSPRTIIAHVCTGSSACLRI